MPERVDVSQLEDYRSFKEIDNEGRYFFSISKAIKDCVRIASIRVITYFSAKK